MLHPCARRLPYVEAVIMEVMRMYYVVPITGPRRALHDAKLMGYDIPKVYTL